MKNKKKIIILSILLIIWLIIIFILSNMNSSTSNKASSDIISNVITKVYEFTSTNSKSIPSEENISIASKVLNVPARKFMHMFIYFMLGFLLMIITNFIRKKPAYLKSFIIVIIICIVCASLDEYHQLFVGRTGRIQDVLIDSIGSILGILFYGTYYLVYKLALKKKD